MIVEIRTFGEDRERGMERRYEFETALNSSCDSFLCGLHEDMIVGVWWNGMGGGEVEIERELR